MTTSRLAAVIAFAALAENLPRVKPFRPLTPFRLRSTIRGSPPSISAAAAFSDAGSDDEEKGAEGTLDMGELARRINALSVVEAEKSATFEEGLRRRTRDVAAAEALDRSTLEPEAFLPVITFDALLPNQRLSGSTDDPTFCRLLRDLGLGGLFVMVSLDYKQRKIRRSGVVTKIEIVDVDREGGPEIPTAVTFSVVGLRRCRVVGPSMGMVARVGRWRGGYDPDGEETMLGWGDERFVDAPIGIENVSVKEEEGGVVGRETREEVLHHTEWECSPINCTLSDDEKETADADVLSRAVSLLPLLDRWLELASDPFTYNNVDVVASTRRRKGYPGLRVDASRLLQNVMSDLGERPPPSRPTDLAFWATGLINPLPPLGVSPEIRGRVLEAADSKRRLEIVEWGVKRSIQNLEGTAPL